MKQDSIQQHLAERAATHGGIDVLWLYGSRARGEHSASSDYDLAVAFSNYEAEPLARRLRPELLAQEWSQAVGAAVSVVDLNQVPTPLAMEIIEADHVLFCRNDLRLMQEQQRIWSKWAEYKFEYEQNHA